MEEDLEPVMKHQTGKVKKLKNHQAMCYLCLKTREKSLIKIGAKLHEKLKKLGIVTVKVSGSSNSFCKTCHEDIKTMLQTINQVQKANTFWRAIYIKAGYLPPPPKPSQNTEENACNQFECKHCEFKFSTKAAMVTHAWTTHLRSHEEPAKCKICKKRYKNEKRCQKHVFQIHESEKTHLCIICGKSDMSKRTLRLHCLSKHDGMGYNDESIYYYCEICKGVRFQAVKKYHDHMFEYHGVERPPEPKQIIDENQLQTDVLMTATNEDSNDGSENNFGTQSVTVADNSDSDSDICDNDAFEEPKISEMVNIEATADTDSEKNDTIEHEEESDRQCFSAVQQLELMNTGIESFKCPQCNESFSRYFYYLHIWEHFRLPETPSTCKLCDKELKSEESCRKHFLFKHFEKYQVCDICGAGNMTQLELFYHRKSRHPDIHKEEVESRKKQREDKKGRRLQLVQSVQMQLKNNEIEECQSPEESFEEEQVVLILECPTCDKKFKGDPRNVRSTQQLHIWESHVRSHDILQCPCCNKRFEVEYLTRRHYFFVHFEPYYSCDNCKKSGMTYKQVADHLKHELKLKRAGLEVRQWKDVKKKKKKLRTDLTKEKRQCPICQEKFFGTDVSAKWAYLKHAWQAHGRGSDPKRCDKCNKVFETEYYAKTHFHHLHWDKHHSCDLCNVGNLTKHQLWHHKTIVHNNKANKDTRPTLSCPYCCVKLKDPIKFENHKKNHLDTATQPKAVCEICNKMYANSQVMKEHQLRAHLKVFSHHCRYCDSGFYSAGSRRLHEITHHTKEYPFQCSVCGLKGAQIANIKAHIRRAHGISNPSQVLETVVRLYSRGRRSKEEIEAQKIYVQDTNEETENCL